MSLAAPLKSPANTAWKAVWKVGGKPASPRVKSLVALPSAAKISWP